MPIGYWESEHLLAPADLTIIGSGIVGMSTALQYKKLRPKDKVRILERDIIGEGGTTRNAGFACFGGPGEWLDDLEQLGQDRWLRLVEMRIRGLRTLLEMLGQEQIGLEWKGGWELFGRELKGQERARDVMRALADLNRLVAPLLDVGLGDVHPLGADRPALVEDVHRAGILNAHLAIHLPWEGMLHTGRLVSAFHAALDSQGIQRLHGCSVDTLSRLDQGVDSWSISTPRGVFRSQKVAVCTNGFARQLVPELKVETAPNRVLVLTPASGAPPEGCYHAEDGYLYFRTLDRGRVLFGGGRHYGIPWPAPGSPLEEAAAVAAWDDRLVQSAEQWLGSTAIVTHRWTGWLGVGQDREPLIGHTAPGLHHAVRMGGMGIAVGAGIGKELARRIDSE